MNDTVVEKPDLTEDCFDETDMLLFQELVPNESKNEKTTDDIIGAIKYDFAKKKYKAFSRFKTDYPETWKMCLDAISDEKLMGNIIFCNDFLQIPPVDTLLLYKLETESININFGDQEKQAIGALWGFVFKEIFKYSKQYKKASKVPGFRSATYFKYPESPVILKD